ncbi:glycerophosphoryl diester phosphodiesterase [Sinomicrobium oceani]|uniref:Glycerophosphoryl diester phosphodiesterase n=1 Tax=Sinomicrobium oceani TaxID=1150368 RepID=A0A1K1MAB3_9FLAO|nr:glycerophosphodiester phosphodiesterase family protein [Sinomicrobium oceani]SFW20055.1 glycerophosphoryl diester phosphodiesterase [Sinomicrobium oceani]
MKKRLVSVFVLIFILVNCKNNKENHNTTQEKTVPVNEESRSYTQIHEIRDNLLHPDNGQVIVVAHRGDWRNAPENSLPAIQSCIDMGVDMVEIDVRETRDGHLVLMHDGTIDRTTTGKGKVSEWSLDRLKTLRLRDGLGVPTPNRIPTLEEALNLCKGKIMVNLDKSYDIFDKCFEVAQRTGTLDQVIIKGARTNEEVREQFGKYLDKVMFMPMVRLSDPKAEEIINGYMKNDIPVAFEFTVPSDTIALIKRFGEIRSQGAGIWINSLWPQHNGGHDDEKAYADPHVYEWFTDNHINIIQTDRPAILLKYLRSRGYHH